MASRVETASTQISDYQDEVDEEEPSHKDELSTLYDDGSEELEGIRPISAPSQASLFDGYPDDYSESIRQDYGDFNDYSNSNLYTEDYSYDGPSSYNFYNVQPRTVPPFYDSTTHRDTYTWKYTLPERYHDDYYETQYGMQSELPEFQDETTHRETYQNFEFLPPSRESGYSSYGSVVSREVPRFEGQTTHRESYTPKTTQKSIVIPNAYTSRRVRPPPFENLTTNQRDFVRRTTHRARAIQPPRDNLRVGGRSLTPIKTTNRIDFVELRNGCPAEKALRSGLKNAKHRDGHYYFVTRGRRESAPAKLKSRRSKSGSSRSGLSKKPKNSS